MTAESATITVPVQADQGADQSAGCMFTSAPRPQTLVTFSSAVAGAHRVFRPSHLDQKRSDDAGQKKLQSQSVN